MPAMSSWFLGSYSLHVFKANLLFRGREEEERRDDMALCSNPIARKPYISYLTRYDTKHRKNIEMMNF